MKKEFNVVSLFDGMSCLQISFEKLGIKPTKYFAAEIDKHCNKLTKILYPDTIQLGDVRNVKGSDLGFVHFLGGGSPCQSFSFAGKQKGMSTKCEIEITTLDHYLKLKEQNFEFEGQSYLFLEYIRILKELREINPDIIFLLENVVMSKKWEKVLSEAIGINPVKINSALLSAQNRKRLYWSNINTYPDGIFSLKFEIPQPKDKGILLKDILENEVDEKYFLSDKMLNYLNTRKANCNNGKINFKTENDTASCINASSSLYISDNIIIDNNRNAKCFTAAVNSGGLHSQMELIKCDAMRGRNPENQKSRISGLPTEQTLESRNDGKTNCLTSVQKDNLVIQLNPSKESGGKQPYQQNRVYDINGINPSLTTLWNGSNLINTSQIRRLTPRECGRLQTVPEHILDKMLTSGISDTQLYKMFGNGWTIDVIVYILSFMK